MNPSTASNRLIKDILFNFISKDNIKCFHCNEEMTREDFSIEHKIPWLDSENPIDLYFNLDNISFSHISCNVSRRRNIKRSHPSSSSYNYGCRCNDCIKCNTDKVRKYRNNKKIAH